MGTQIFKHSSPDSPCLKINTCCFDQRPSDESRWKRMWYRKNAINKQEILNIVWITAKTTLALKKKKREKKCPQSSGGHRLWIEPVATPSGLSLSSTSSLSPTLWNMIALYWLPERREHVCSESQKTVPAPKYLFWLGTKRKFNLQVIVDTDTFNLETLWRVTAIPPSRFFCTTTSSFVAFVNVNKNKIEFMQT